MKNKKVASIQQDKPKLYLARGEITSLFSSFENVFEIDAPHYLEEQVKENGIDEVISVKEITKFSQVPKGWCDAGIWGVSDFSTARDWFDELQKNNTPGYQKLLKAKAKLVEAQAEYNKLSKKYED
jgi:hypothetical protein